MSTLGMPLAVCRVETNCNTKFEHPVEVVSDGVSFYASTMEFDSAEAVGAARMGAVIGVQCPASVEGQPYCYGSVELDLASDTWTADPQAVAKVVQFGEKVDR